MTEEMAEYYRLRKEVAHIIPRERPLIYRTTTVKNIREKGRKKAYSQFEITEGVWKEPRRLLDIDEFSTFIEISCRASACPMPLNIDTWDGFICPYNCRYCFANNFRTSLYTSFFDNARSIGLRHCNIDKCKKDLDELFLSRYKDPHSIKNAISKAIAMGIPLRFGIRFEDFIPKEAKDGISLALLQHLAEHKYPVMINTKSDLVGKDAYVQALAQNRSAVHVTLISSDDNILQALEPGAPTYEQRLTAIKNLTSAGVRVVARIEPYLPFINDEKESVQKYIEDLWRAGVRNITFDTYSYTAKNPGIRQAFRDAGMDWKRIILVGCDSQALGSLLLGAFMKMFRAKGFSCSTFDMGNVPDNDQDICCEVGDWFKTGFNYGSSVMAARFIQRHKDKPQSWNDFNTWVNEHGGFLSPALKHECHQLWNAEGNYDAYSHHWARGMEAVGCDKYGTIWTWRNTDFRNKLYDNIYKGASTR